MLRKFNRVYAVLIEHLFNGGPRRGNPPIFKGLNK